MSYSEIRAKARQKLTGKWGKLACFTLVYLLVVMLIDGILARVSESVGSLIVILISVPLGFSFAYTFYRVYKNDEDVDYGRFFNDAINNFAISWKIQLRVILKVLVPFIIVVVSMILAATLALTAAFSTTIYPTDYAPSSANSAATAMSSVALICSAVYVVAMIWLAVKSLYYVYAQVVYFDDPSLTAKECVEKSQALMHGHRGKYFVLSLTFIGWAFLATFTFGIGYLFLMPYITFAQFVFYSHLKGDKEEEPTVPAAEPTPEVPAEAEPVEPTIDVEEKPEEDNGPIDEN